MELFNLILQIISIICMITALAGSFLMCFILKKQKIGKILFWAGFTSLFLVIILSFITNLIIG